MSDNSSIEESPQNDSDVSAENVAWSGREPAHSVVEHFQNGLINPGDLALDIGCGFGRNSNWLASRGVNVIGINNNKDELAIAENLAKEVHADPIYLEASATQLPLRDNTFDVVLDWGCSHMLSMEGQTEAEKEQARVIKEGGYLIYFGFTKKHPAWKNDQNPMFRDLEEVMAQYGADFDIVKVEEVEWRPLKAEKAEFDMHKGAQIVMKRKQK